MNAWSRALAFERYELVRRVWSLASDRGEIAPQLRLRPDGRIGCQPDRETPFWDVRGETLVLLDAAGRARAAFDEVGDAAGRPCLSGHLLDVPARKLTLTETDPVETWPEPGARRHLRAREELQPRRNLLVATGDTLGGWAEDLRPEDRNWDLCLLRDPDAAASGLEPDWEAAPPPGERWATLHALLFPGSKLFRYDHVLFLGEGVGWSWAAANASFVAARAHDLLLAHPVATVDGLEPEPGRALGFTIPAALHAPIFSAEALRVCAPSFALAPAGSPEFAQLWCALLGASPTRVAVIDGVAPLVVAKPAARGRKRASPKAGGLLERFGLAAAAASRGTLRAP